MAWVATAVIGAAAVGGAAKAYSAYTASQAQVGAAGQAKDALVAGATLSQEALKNYNNIAQSYLEPYRAFGKTGMDELTSKIPGLTTPLPVSQAQKDLAGPLQVSKEQMDLAGPLAITPEQLALRAPIQLTQDQLEQIPGYEFTRTQGLKAVQNSAAARGLGVSGAAEKGAAAFATGLASEKALAFGAQEMQNRQEAFNRYAATYGQAAAEREAAAGRFGQIFQQQQSERQLSSGREAQIWGQEQQGQQSAFDRLMGIIGAGETGAVAGGALSQRTGQGISTSFTDASKGFAGATVGAGNAEAAGINAIGGAISDTATNIGGYMAYKGLYGNPGVTPNMSYIKGSAGDTYVPTFGR